MGKLSYLRHEKGSSSSTSSAPWKDVMNRSVSFQLPNHDPFSPRGEPTAISALKSQRHVEPSNPKTKITNIGRSFSMDHRSGAKDAVSSTPVPWKEMFKSASFRKPDLSPRDNNNNIARAQNPAQPQLNHPSSTPAELRTAYFQATPDSPHLEVNPVISPEIYVTPREQPLDQAPETNQTVEVSESQVANENSSLVGNNQNIDPQNPEDIYPENEVLSMETNTISPGSSEINSMIFHCIKFITLPSDPQLRMAVYVTMAQAVLAVLLILFYDGFKLLEEYLRPIIWAALCSIPLRGIQDTLVEFWSEPLKLGLTETILAIPVAVLKVLVGTIVDAQDVFNWAFHGKELLLSGPAALKGTSGFLKLFRRLVSFGIFVFAYEQIGSIGLFTLLGLGFMLSSSGSYQAIVSTVSSLRSDSFRLRRDTGVDQNRISVLVAHSILSRLKTILAVALILGMMFAFFAGIIYFSYRVGIEAKDAAISLKSHLEENNYAERLGIKKWIEENEVMQVVEWYTNECYETLWQQIDSLSAKYNMTEFMKLVKHLVVSPPTFSTTDPHPPSGAMNFSGLRNLKLVMTELLVTKEDMFEKAKCLATQGIDEFLRVIAGSRYILDGCLNLVLSMFQSMIHGAAGLVSFVLQSTVFFWVLYYLLTSESGGVTEQVMKMIPISKPTKNRCIEALNHAISGVLVATAEIAFFQGCFTWLLCRLYSVHFVYTSTILAFISPLLPIFPPWLPALPAALELILDRRYLLAASFCVTHLVLMDCGASEIAKDVPGYSAYLTGVSIIGGMTLFPSALEGAIMGPLITTLVIALKDLYAEFVLNEPKDDDQ